ncbi:hypothetical protein PILCRDRAFT_261486 [Piloderma croceum F 1598]|uniref:Uncharacterized protein n=1 Tax=Piloderma croceum (strain F 1598) TaxID=765440 RepID=A0A0C3CDK7_PILCF|nr:hypothetical protein PILCRDRAFT_261486 [Piloderma croceum F 1598]
MYTHTLQRDEESSSTHKAPVSIKRQVRMPPAPLCITAIIIRIYTYRPTAKCKRFDADYVSLTYRTSSTSSVPVRLRSTSSSGRYLPLSLLPWQLLPPLLT